MQDINFYNTGVHVFLAEEKSLPYLNTLVLSSWRDFFFFFLSIKPCPQPEMLNSGFALMVVR